MCDQGDGSGRPMCYDRLYEMGDDNHPKNENLLNGAIARSWSRDYIRPDESFGPIINKNGLCVGTGWQLSNILQFNDVWVIGKLIRGVFAFKQAPLPPDIAVHVSVNGSFWGIPEYKRIIAALQKQPSEGTGDGVFKMQYLIYDGYVSSWLLHFWERISIMATTLGRSDSSDPL